MVPLRTQTLAPHSEQPAIATGTTQCTALMVIVMPVKPQHNIDRPMDHDPKPTTTIWLCKAYVPVFQAIACLEVIAEGLHDTVLELHDNHHPDPHHTPHFHMQQHLTHLPRCSPNPQYLGSFLFPPLPLPTATSTP